MVGIRKEMDFKFFLYKSCACAHEVRMPNTSKRGHLFAEANANSTEESENGRAAGIFRSIIQNVSVYAHVIYSYDLHCGDFMIK